MKIMPISGALGAKVSDIDLSQKLSTNDSAIIYRDFLKYKVLFFENQLLSPKQFVSFAKVIGCPSIYPFIKGLQDAPEVIEIIKTKEDKKNFGGSWHSDTSYMDKPDMATLLYAKHVPYYGGDTLFANTALAYDQLSSGMKELLSGLSGINSSEKSYVGGRAAGMNQLDAMKHTFDSSVPTYISEHPIVRRHPETGLKSLYLNLSHTIKFKDMKVEESIPLINYLCAHMVKPEFTCRFRWSRGAMAIWDNRTTLHHAVNDYPNQKRHMQRITIAGDRPC
ncbi:MAG: taurine dioxygenase [Rhodospirillaceae bacterium]|nr:taurine dioxygenase [Rhodospirillaceae bacterium]|tara:strand:+ start:1415 stop:2251 length:837 start_codon:yes stop_codon:yes gene_type:complete